MLFYLNEKRYTFIALMNEFSIRDIENLSGIKAHTWRIWEQRYAIGIAQRKESNHRFFDNDNLKRILRIAYLYHSGIKISKIAALKSEEMKVMALSQLPKESEEFYINELTEAAIDLDEEKFEQTFNQALKKMGVEETILKVINPFQEKIGVLWLTDHLIPSQEHFTSNIIRLKLTIAIDNLRPLKTMANPQIVLFAPEGERHDLTLHFIHYLLKKSNNKVTYFGGNTSLESIKIYEEKNGFNCLFFHLVTCPNNISLNEYLQKISGYFPDKQIIMSGGQVEKITSVPENVRLLKSMSEMVGFAKE